MSIEGLGAAREAVAGASPLVHCLTNTVVQTVTANVLLAVGAAPAMVDEVQEAGDFAAIASSVLINVGTVHERTAAAMLVAARSAVAAGRPWVLDPVAVGALRFRTDLARQLLDIGPTVLRGNASEVMVLAGAGAGGRGVDSTARAEDAADAAGGLARRTGVVVAASGEVDVLTDGARTVRVAGGHPLLTRTTGTGCALGALVAAYLAVGPDPLTAAVAAHAHLAVAAAAAARRASGPGSFAVALIDALDAVTAADLDGADVQEVR